jgi:hypothetical protein
MSTPLNVKIIEPQSKAEQARHKQALANIEARHKQALEDVQARQKINTAAIKQKQLAIVAAEEKHQQVTDPPMKVLVAKRDELKVEVAQAVKDNSIHRIAEAVFKAMGYDYMSDQQLATAKNFFSWFSAVIVAGAAGAIALAYYAPPKKPWLMRTIRAWFLRLRKRVVRTELKETVVEKVVKVDVPGPALREVPILFKETTVKIVPVRGLEGEQQPFTVVDKVTGAEAEAKLRVVRGHQ